MDETSTTASVLAAIQEAWKRLHAYIRALTPEQLTAKADSAGWTVKDHLMHLSLWEGSLLALLEGRDRYEEFGITKEQWYEGADAINAVLKTRHENKTLDEVYAAMEASHAKVLATVGAMSDADLQLPYHHFQPAAKDRTQPVVGWIDGNTAHHYDEHLPWIKAIAEG